MLGVPENPVGFPEHKHEKERKRWTGSNATVREKETKDLPLMAQVPKILNPFTRALTPPFIGRRRDFYIPITPLSSRNIPNVNTYKNVFFHLTHLQACH
jgi:hypothetical protein